MKYLTLVLLPLFFLFTEERDSKMKILDAWISTQNKGTNESIEAFMDKYYHPDILGQMKNRDKHIVFYRQIIDEFGDVQKSVYKVMESTDSKLKVQLIKSGIPLVPKPRPEDILVVEIDLHPHDNSYLERGLGMGALICYIRR